MEPRESKMLTCADCDHPFVWTAGEQEFFEQHQLQQPKRCKECRRARREQKEAAGR